MKYIVVISIFILSIIGFNSCKEEEPVIEKPELSDLTISNVDKTSVNFAFSLLNDNGGEISEIGICWDTLDYPTIYKNKLELELESVEYSDILINLESDTQYYLRAYAINSAGTAYSQPIGFRTKIPYYEGTIVDIENNEYEIISMGNQIWMSDNLISASLNDNTDILLVEDATEWSEATYPAYCWYSNNQAENVEDYGALYNFAAVETGKLCPTGYHVPTIEDWEELEIYLIENEYNYDGTSSGNKFAKSLASKEGWTYSEIEGSIGNDMSTNNATGFNVYPTGIRNNVGEYLSKEYASSLWTSGIVDENDAYSIDLFNSNPAVYVNLNPKVDCFSVRCVKD
ncbi:MAG: hypothetical protein C0596_11635 [Marinilabiliales bacterium]|nr:MAG: hypothetical protein C0596_11635 [Marinilabiliales bacterium]